METVAVYIPTDRRHALAQGVDLPERALGAALFADISGFTALTEALVRSLGPQRGAEELAWQINVIYDALIAEVDRYGGSVISFSGDAITCWFGAKDEDGKMKDGSASADSVPSSLILYRSSLRAAACGLAMQAAMAQFASVAIPGMGSVGMAIKVSVAAGPVRRFLVGDASIQLIDVLAGETLARLAHAEHHTKRGEVVLDAPTVAVLGDAPQVVEWRTDEISGARFAVVNGLAVAVAPAPWPEIASDALSEEIARRWQLPPVYERLRNRQGEFLTELRPATALFLRFGDIDYDGDDNAQQTLHTFIQQVQRILARYDSSLIQLTIGDKGSYLYAAFGAPLAHEDDTVRAVASALELIQLQPQLIDRVQIGISQGRMRTGAYGGTTRRTYGVLGDEVNMAARLMQHASAHEVLVSLAARKCTGDLFTWDSLPPMLVKGKSEPVTVFQLIGQQERSAIRLHEPQYARPMVGRRAELTMIASRLDRSLRGQGQMIGITAEAGMGKSRLVAEIIRLAQNRRMIGYGGECQSYGTHTSYLVWQSIWRSLFGLDHINESRQQILALERNLGLIDSALLPRLPLLGAVLGLDIPDNELTNTFDAKLRKASLEALLTDCLRARASESPLLLVLEDCHWIDPLSRDLLEVIGRAIASLPVVVVLAYRPAQLPHIAALPVSHLTYFSEVTLTTLTPEDIGTLVQNKISHVYGEQARIPDQLTTHMIERTQGNPFYIEELLNYLHDRQIDLQQPNAIQQVDLPTSLHSLILSRIDQLSEDQRTLLKVASVIGRQFQAAMLWGLSTFFGMRERLGRDLEVLTKLELTAQDTPDPELTYLFKHILTQEVAYESLPYATRATLHEQIAEYIERSLDASGRSIDLLAFHYDRSTNASKRQEYLLKAGTAAQHDYANVAAVDYYQRVLPLLDAEEQCAVMLRLGQVFEVMGQWSDAHTRYDQALARADQLGEQRLKAQAQALIGELLRKQGQYAQARPWLEEAQAGYTALGDQAGVAQALHFMGLLNMHQGNYDAAREYYEASLAIRRTLNDQLMMGSLLSNLSIVAYHQGDAERAWHICNESLALRRAVGNKLWIANSLGNLGMLAFEAGRYNEAHDLMSEALALERVVGDRSAIAISLNNLGNVARERGDYAQAPGLYRESLIITSDLGDSWALCYLLEDIGCLAALRHAADLAIRLAGAAASLREAINAPLSPPEQASLDRKLASAREALGITASIIWDEGRTLGKDQAITFALATEP